MLRKERKSAEYWLDLAEKALVRKRKKIIEGQQTSAFQCFWTWPFGHIWGEHPDTHSSYDRMCVICSKESTRGQYDGDWFFDLHTRN